MEKKSIGFIGAGVMGKAMAANLMKAGFPVFIYTRTKEKAAELLENGAAWKESPRQIAEAADVVITMVGYPKDVEEIYFGNDGLLSHAKQGAYLVDMTTSSPLLAKRIFQEAQRRGIAALDAPVSGGDIGARDGKLTIMAGGDKQAFDSLQPVFAALGTNIRYLGAAGSGQYTKMCNQIAIASNMMGVAEAVCYAKKVGLNPSEVLAAISAGPAGSWSLSNLAPRMIKGDFAPGFFVKHFIKDMKIALESAREVNLALPGLALAEQLYEELARQGGENDGTQALIKLLDK